MYPDESFIEVWALVILCYLTSIFRQRQRRNQEPRPHSCLTLRRICETYISSWNIWNKQLPRKISLCLEYWGLGCEVWDISDAMCKEATGISSPAVPFISLVGFSLLYLQNLQYIHYISNFQYISNTQTPGSDTKSSWTQDNNKYIDRLLLALSAPNTLAKDQPVHICIVLESSYWSTMSVDSIIALLTVITLVVICPVICPWLYEAVEANCIDLLWILGYPNRSPSMSVVIGCHCAFIVCWFLILSMLVWIFYGVSSL